MGIYEFLAYLLGIENAGVWELAFNMFLLSLGFGHMHFRLTILVNWTIVVFFHLHTVSIVIKAVVYIHVYCSIKTEFTSVADPWHFDSYLLTNESGPTPAPDPASLVSDLQDGN